MAAYSINENVGPIRIELVLSNPPLTNSIVVQVLDANGSTDRSATGEQYIHSKWSI